MFEFIRNFRQSIVIIIVLVFPLLAYRAEVLEPSEVSIVDRTVLFVTSPVRRFLARAQDVFVETWLAYTDLRLAREDASELRQNLRNKESELQLLRSRLALLPAVETLLKLQDNYKTTGAINARVIGHGIAPGVRTLEIDKGSLNQINRSFPVLSNRGLVGIVARSAWESSTVLATTDPRFFVDARIVRTRAHIRLSGDGKKLSSVRAESTVRTSDVEAGDELETSGMANLFPAGVPIGKVVRIISHPKIKDEVMLEAEPGERFSDVELVVVLLKQENALLIETPDVIWKHASEEGKRIVNTETSTASKNLKR